MSLEDENKNLEACVDVLKNELNQSRRDLIEIQSDRDMLSCQLEIEKKNSKLQIKQIEDKLQDTQDLLMVKLQELNNSQQIYLPLRQEIESLKNLIQSEESRLGLSDNHLHRSLKLSDHQMSLSSTNSVKHNESMTSPSNLQLSHSTHFVPLVTDEFTRAPPRSNPANIFTSTVNDVISSRNTNYALSCR